MKSRSYQVGCRTYGKLNYLEPKKQHISAGLIMTLAIIFPVGILLYTPVSSAQNTITQSLSLDKNIIYVNPETGDDSQPGKKFMPLKTITQALKIANSGTKIQLATGTYNEATGETFPLVIKNNIVIQGNAKNQGYKIIIQGGGDFVSPTGAGQNVAIAALKDAGGIIGVTVTNNHSRGHGLWIESSSPKVTSNTFTRNGNTGVSVNGHASPVIEDNYFYNNSGNGLLIYGTSKTQVAENTFEQTGFGVSLVQQADANLNSNYFDSNRIGIILEGESQAKLRDNEIVNSMESGLTAIAQSQVDLGTNHEPGNNVFRSNKKLDIQNATNNEIPAVGTETHGETIGKINFESGEFVALKSSQEQLPSLLPPLNSNSNTASLNPTTPTDTTATALPFPPPLPDSKTNNKELIFNASSSAISQDLEPEPEPVPFLPEIRNSALTSNPNQISSLSDVLGASGAVSVKYKVLVEADDTDTQAEVRSLYPQAFATVYQGRSVLQVGAFNNWDKAKQAQRSLDDLGLDTYILE